MTFNEQAKAKVKEYARMVKFFQELKRGDIFFDPTSNYLFKVVEFSGDHGMAGQALKVHVLASNEPWMTPYKVLWSVTAPGWQRVPLKEFPLYLTYKQHSKEFYRLLKGG